MNVLNVHQVERELEKLVVYAIHPQAKVWVRTVARNHILSGLSEKDVVNNYRPYAPPVRGKVSDMPPLADLPDWAFKAYKEKTAIHWFDPIQVLRRPVWMAIETILDWFNSFSSEDKRLNRLSRINFTTAAAAAAMWAKDIKDNLWHYVVDRPPVAYKSTNGYYWVKMITALHFEREGRMMSHCVGNGSYYDRFRRGQADYYSLRDKENVPHVTAEVVGKQVQQVKGKSNHKPSATYQPHIMPFVRALNLTVTGDHGNIDGAPRGD